MVANAEEVYRSYYTKSDPIVRYMVERLSVSKGMSVLEPCAGDGVFIDALNGSISNLEINIYELNPRAIAILHDKYDANKNISIKQGDALTDPDLILFSNTGGVYDRIIANPPYGGWLEHEQRKDLKKLFPNLYIKETYGLFLYRCVQLLRSKGILVFIIPDTFLNLHMHTKLREYLLKNTKIQEICLFPSSFFPGVNFGYSNLCTIALEKCSLENECLRNEMRVVTGLRNVSELGSLGETVQPYHKIYTFKQSDIYRNIDHALFISDNSRITYLINNCETKIGEIADCVTGFYSGNDKQYLHRLTDEAKNAAKYSALDESQICDDYLSRPNVLEGLEGNKHFIPIVKGGGTKFFKPDAWYMDWSLEAVKDYKENKKARFQNSRYYFEYGIGVPMVSSSQITAALIENRLFDQSIVGIFPHNPKWIYYLLALFNSSICNRLIRTINPSTNNSANYIKKIPFILPSASELKEIDTLVENILNNLKAGKPSPNIYEIEIEHQLKNIYGLTEGLL